MEYVEWCSLCHEAPAEGALTGYFSGLSDEVLTLMACNKCASKAFEVHDEAGIR